MTKEVFGQLKAFVELLLGPQQPCTFLENWGEEQGCIRSFRQAG